MAILRRFPGYVTTIVLLFIIVSAAQAKYSGGTGEPNDPYQIATAENLMLLGESPEDYDKHFILTADIDLDPNLPRRKIFDRAVIAPDPDDTNWWFDGTPFSGVFDGNGHAISHVRIVGRDYLGLFGQLGWGFLPGGEVRALRVVDVRITGSGNYVAGLAGINRGTTTHCSSSGIVSAIDSVGGLVGANAGTVTGCYSTGAVRGRETVGGLVGHNEGSVTHCYSIATVSGTGENVGGLVGLNIAGTIARCYSVGVVRSEGQAGGLVGTSEPFGRPQSPAVITESFWDIQTSGQSMSAGGIGLTTREMQTSSTFLGWGSYGPSWTIDEGRGYPRLAWEDMPGQVIPGPTYAGGTGTAQDPYLILTAEQFNWIGIASGHWDKHFKLMADVDLSGFDGKDGRPALNVIAPGREWYTPSGEFFVGTPFSGVFDGNGHRVSHMTVKTDGCGGLFGRLEGEVMNLAVVDVNITSSGGPVGGVVAWNVGTLLCCCSTGAVSGTYGVGGSVGWNDLGTVTQCYSECAVSGNSSVGGLIGRNRGVASNSYNIGAASGVEDVGGLVGLNDGGTVTHCYAIGAANGIEDVGGLVGGNASGGVLRSFWDMQASGQAESAGGTGKTTAEMQMAKTFLDAGWDFVGETANGSEDIWKIVEGLTYPLLSWQKYSGGTGEPNDPYQIATAEDLITLGETPEDYDKHFILTADIDLDPNLPGRKAFDRAVIAPDTDPNDKFYVFQGIPFTGVFDGNDHSISSLTIKGENYVGLFGYLEFGAEVKDLAVIDVNITGSGDYIGGLVGSNGSRSSSMRADRVGGTTIRCYTTGAVSGSHGVGGLMGYNGGTVLQCYSTGVIIGEVNVGGLVGENVWEHMIQCFSTGGVSGTDHVGGLVGWNGGVVKDCYTTGSVSGNSFVGGLAGGFPTGIVADSFCDIQTSGQATSAGGTGKTTAEMHDPNTFMAAGWDFVGQPDGPHDIWVLPEGGGYPILWWQQSPLPSLPRFSGGTGEPNDPYLISEPKELNSIGHNPRLMKCYFKLVADLDLAGLPYCSIGADYYRYDGVFDGNGKAIQGLSHSLFGGVGGAIKNLRLIDPHCVGSPVEVNYGTITCCSVQGGIISGEGGLVGYNHGDLIRCYSTSAVAGNGGLVGSNIGTVTDCYSSGAVSGGSNVGGLVGSSYGIVTRCHSTASVHGGQKTGGLVGSNGGDIVHCYSTAAVSGNDYVGGLVGYNNDGSITTSFSTSAVSGRSSVGGLVGYNRDGSITTSFSTGTVSSSGFNVGGLVGYNEYYGTVTHCYSTGAVSGNYCVGGLVGWNAGYLRICFWDIQTSGQTKSAGGTGKTTAEMQTASTFLEAGWDFVGETANGTEDIWWMPENDYPKLWWELIPEN